MSFKNIIESFKNSEGYIFIKTHQKAFGFDTYSYYKGYPNDHGRAFVIDEIDFLMEKEKIKLNRKEDKC